MKRLLRLFRPRSPDMLEREAGTHASFALVDECHGAWPTAVVRWSEAAQLLEDATKKTGQAAEKRHRKDFARQCWESVARCADRARDTVSERCWP